MAQAGYCDIKLMISIIQFVRFFKNAFDIHGRVLYIILIFYRSYNYAFFLERKQECASFFWHRTVFPAKAGIQGAQNHNID